jgi:AcrR family transcriptional regulator
MSSGATTADRAPGLRGQAQRGERTRGAIVDAAMEVFAVQGFRASALADIAGRVGLTPGGILYHFGSKDALLLAVIAERDRRAADMLAELPSSGLESLWGLIEIARLCEREPGLAALHTVLQVESLSPGAPAHRYFRDRSRFVREWLEQVLVDAQDAGEVGPGIDCAAKACELVAFLDGAAVLWLLDRSLSLVELYQSYLATFVDVVGPRAHG